MLRSLGVRVTTLPFELHPGIPADGVPRRSRYSAAAAEAAAVGVAFSPPDRVPNTRRVLEVSEWVRRVHAGAFSRFEEAVFRAYWVEGVAIDSVDVLDGLLAGVGVSPAEAWDAVAEGSPSGWVASSMALARSVGVGGTPAWVLGPDPETGLLIPGVQPRAFFERVVAKMRARAAGPTA